MPRSETTYNVEASKEAIAPIKLLRVLDIPEVADPAVVSSLYFTDCAESVDFFDAAGNAQLYTACSLKITYAEVGTDNKVNECRVSIDNVDRSFSALAQTCHMNGVFVEVLRVLKDKMDTPDCAQTMFVGKIKSIVFNEAAIDATVTNDAGLSALVPRRLYWPNLFPYIPSAKDVRNASYATE